MEMEFVQRKLCTLKCVHNKAKKLNFQAVQYVPTWCQQGEISRLITEMVIRDVLHESLQPSEFSK